MTPKAKVGWASLGAATVAIGMLGGCSGHYDGRVTVTPESSLFDQPVHIVVHDVPPDSRVNVTLRSTDSDRHSFTSGAVFRSTGSGTVDLATAPALDGSYLGVNPMGLIQTLQAATGPPTLYFWAGPRPQGFYVTVADGGSTVAAGQFRRTGAATGVTVRQEAIAATGFYGQFWRPPAGRSPRPAILEFGGSEGGLSGQLLGAALASAGYPTLDVAYFNEPGLPQQLKDIPLEYFARALRWLARQPGVLARRIWVSGGSRGSEAALLLGAYYPSLVHGVIASTPSDAAICSYPGCTGPAWTLHGKPLPYTRLIDDPAPTDDPAAVIPVQKIRGPVFLDCGTADKVWTSCAYAQTIQQRLAAAHDPHPHVLYRYQGGGHLLNGLVPYEPSSAAALAAVSPQGEGGTFLANDDADGRLWPHLLHFLANPTGQTGTFTAPATPPSLPTLTRG